MSLSAVIITLNEQKNIGKCLKALSFCDEIIIVDSGSKDDTLKIAKRNGAKIIKMKWLGYSRTKNFGVSKAKSNWVLSIDADEAVSAPLAREILNVTKKTENDGFFIPRKPFFLGKEINHCGWYPDFQLRLFRRKKGGFDEKKEVHENIVLNGRIGYLKNDLLHYSYQTLDDYFNRFNKYTSLAAEQMLNKGKKGILINLMLNPFFTFFKMYVLKAGFLDGFAGFTVCLLSSYYNFVKYAKLWELKKKIK